MSGLVLPGAAARGRRPTGPFRLNSGSPQAKGLLEWYPGERKGVSAFGRSVVTESTYLSLNNRPGIDVVSDLGADDGGFNGTDGRYITVPLLNSDPVTITGWFFDNTGAGGVPSRAMGGLSGAPHDGNWSMGAYLQCATDPRTIDCAVVTTSGGAARYTATGTKTVPNKSWFLFGYTFNPGAGLSSFVNGVPDAVNSTTTTTLRDVSLWQHFSTQGLDGAGGFLDGGLGFCGMVVDARLYRRALTAADHWALYDPATRWDLYWVPGRRAFFDGTGGGGGGFKSAWAARSNVIIQPGVAAV